MCHSYAFSSVLCVDHLAFPHGLSRNQKGQLFGANDSEKKASLPIIGLILNTDYIGWRLITTVPSSLFTATQQNSDGRAAPLCFGPLRRPVLWINGLVNDI